LDVAAESTKGSLILLLGNVGSTAISAVAVILVTRLLGPDSYGIYTLIFVVPQILYLFTGLGVATAVTRFVAYHLSRGEVDKAVQVTESSLAFVFGLGLLLTLASLLVGPYIASVILARSSLGPYIPLASILILFWTLTDCSTAALVGWGKTKRVSVLYFLQAVTKLTVAPALILLGYGIYGAVIGQVVSYGVEAGAGVLMLFIMMPRAGGNRFTGLIHHMTEMLGYGIPVYLGSLVVGLASRYITVVLALVATDVVIGYYQAAFNIVASMTLVSASVGVMLIRSFASLDGLGGDIRQAFDYATRYLSYVLTPILLFFISAASPLFGVIYGKFYVGGAPLLEIMAVAFLTVSFGQTVLQSYFNGTGKTRFTLATGLASATTLVGGLLTLGLWLNLGADGVIYALLISHIVETSLGLVLAKRYLKVYVSFRPLLGIVAAGLLSVVAVHVIPAESLPGILQLFLDLGVFLVVYLTAVPLFRGMRIDDLNRLASTLNNAGPLGILIRPLLDYEKLVVRVFRLA
jgi:O-antigen/teichoic acid export membrane protein